MPVDFWPYSGRQGGRVDDLEHEALWSSTADGVLPGQDSNAVYATVSGGQWTVRPGSILIRGKVLRLLDAESGDIPSPANAARWCVITAYVDRSADPWEAGVRLVRGRPGGGRPNVGQSDGGVYEVPLRAIRIAPDGAVTVGPDERPILTHTGTMPLRRLYLSNAANLAPGEATYGGSWAEEYGVGASWPFEGHSAVSVIPRTGYWRMNATVRFPAVQGGSRQVELVTGAGPDAGDASDVIRRVYQTAEGRPARNISLSLDTIARLDTGETVAIRVKQTSGETMQIVTGSPFTWCELQWVRPL